MKRKIILVSLITLLVMIKQSDAQPYATGIGVRFGGVAWGIDVKHFTGTSTALEGIVGFGRHSIILTGLYEKHQEFPTAPGLFWYYGGGAHVGFVQNDYSYHDFYYHHHEKEGHDDLYDSNFFLGADFILGMEYKFQNTPISLGLDMKPFVDIVPGFYGYWEGAFTFRFTL
jgi:hypothetical protein